MREHIFAVAIVSGLPKAVDVQLPHERGEVGCLEELRLEAWM